MGRSEALSSARPRDAPSVQRQTSRFDTRRGVPVATTSAGPAGWTFRIRKQASAIIASQHRNGGTHSAKSARARSWFASFCERSATMGPVSSRIPGGFTRRSLRGASCWLKIPWALFETAYAARCEVEGAWLLAGLLRHQLQSPSHDVRFRAARRLLQVVQHGAVLGAQPRVNIRLHCDPV